MRRLLILLVLLSLSALGQGHSTAVTAVVKDAHGALYTNASYDVVLVLPAGTTRARTANGGVLAPRETTVRGRTNTDGKLSLSLADNHSLRPRGTRWRFTICAQAAGVPCFHYATVITGAGMDLTLDLQAVAPLLPARARNSASPGQGEGGTIQAAAGVFNNGDDIALKVTGSIQQQAQGATDLEINHGLFATAPHGVYPLGGDILIGARGPADIWVTHAAGATAATATSVDLSPGPNNHVLVGSTANFTACANAPLIVGRDTPSEEIAGTCAIVDGSHINLTLAKSHTCAATPCDLEQIGNTVLTGGYSIVVQADKPAHATNAGTPVRLVDSSGRAVLGLPNNVTDPFPYGALNIYGTITGTSAFPLAPGDLAIRNASATRLTHMVNAAGTDQLVIQDSAVQVDRLVFAGKAPSCAVAGAGSGAACAVQSGSTDSSGLMVVSVGASAGKSGTIALTYSSPLGTNGSSCTLMLVDGTGAWNVRATVIGVGAGSTSGFNARWDNDGAPLSSAGTYAFSYHCGGQ